MEIKNVYKCIKPVAQCIEGMYYQSIEESNYATTPVIELFEFVINDRNLVIGTRRFNIPKSWFTQDKFLLVTNVNVSGYSFSEDSRETARKSKIGSSTLVGIKKNGRELNYEDPDIAEKIIDFALDGANWKYEAEQKLTALLKAFILAGVNAQEVADIVMTGLSENVLTTTFLAELLGKTITTYGEEGLKEYKKLSTETVAEILRSLPVEEERAILEKVADHLKVELVSQEEEGEVECLD